MSFCQGESCVVVCGLAVQSPFGLRRRLQACLLFQFNFSLFKFIFLVALNSILIVELIGKILIV